MTSARHHDVLILGGGPAGSAAAISLARLGFDVAVVERSAFPRSHVGICLADQTLALLDHLGAGDAFRAAGFWRRRQTAVQWAGEEVSFVEQIGYHVDRGGFDCMLLGRARAAGVAVYQTAGYFDIHADGSNGWKGQLASEGIYIPLSCAFIIDAAGRRPALSGVRIKDSPPLLALHAAWHLDRPLPYDGMIASGANGWAWYAQTGEDRAILSVFVDPNDGRSGGRDRLSATYARLLERFPALMGALQGSTPGKVEACDAASTHVSDPVGDRFIRVGDAAMCVDPLSSQGVHLALQSGIQAAIVVNTVLRRPGDAALAQGFYCDRIKERVDKFADQARVEYRNGFERFTSPFWCRRAGDPVSRAELIDASLPEARPLDMANVLTVASDVSFVNGAVISGDFVEERPMLTHANLDRPVAYLGGVEIGALLACLPQRFSMAALRLLWSDHLDASGSHRAAAWLWQRRLIIDAGERTQQRSSALVGERAA